MGGRGRGTGSGEEEEGSVERSNVVNTLSRNEYTSTQSNLGLDKLARFEKPKRTCHLHI